MDTQNKIGCNVLKTLIIILVKVGISVLSTKGSCQSFSCS